MYEVCTSSGKLASIEGNGRATKYPWRELTVGTSFFVPKEEVKEATLRSLAYKTGKRLGCIFKVVRHDTGYEVGMIRS